MKYEGMKPDSTLSEKGANFRACDGDERRGYGAAEGAKKSPVVAKSPDTDKLDKVLFIGG